MTNLYKKRISILVVSSLVILGGAITLSYLKDSISGKIKTTNEDSSLVSVETSEIDFSSPEYFDENSLVDESSQAFGDTEYSIHTQPIPPITTTVTTTPITTTTTTKIQTTTKPATTKVTTKVTTAKATTTKAITTKVTTTKATTTVTTKAPVTTTKPATTTSSGNSNSEYVLEVFRLINIERANAGLSNFTLSDSLNNAAAIRANEIIQSFSHTRPDGSSCFTVLSDLSISYTNSGENIAAGQATPADVVTAWMNSPGHRTNILNSKFNKIGIGYVTGGNYGHNWTQLFTN